MCYICSESIPMETRIGSFKHICAEMEKDKNIFENFNTTSIFFLLFSCCGMYGKEAKTLSIKILNEFVIWASLNKPLYYLPKGGLEKMYHPLVIRKIVDYYESLPDLYIDVEDMNEMNNKCKMEYLIHLETKFNEFEKEIEPELIINHTLDKILDKKYNIKYNRLYILGGYLIGFLFGYSITIIYINYYGTIFQLK